MTLDAYPTRSKPLERIMVFIDGGYLRELCKRYYGHDNLIFGKLSWTFIRMFDTYSTNPFRANLIRIYYYDAIVDERHQDYDAQRKYFQAIDDQYAFTVRLGGTCGIIKQRIQTKER